MPFREIDAAMHAHTQITTNFLAQASWRLWNRTTSNFLLYNIQYSWWSWWSWWLCWSWSGQDLTFQVTCVGHLGQLSQFLRCLWLVLPGLGLLRWHIPRTHLAFQIQRLQPDANGYLISKSQNKKFRGKKLVELYEEKGMKRLAESGHNYFRVPFAIYVYFLNYKMSTYQIATQTFERCKAKIYGEVRKDSPMPGPR